MTQTTPAMTSADVREALALLERQLPGLDAAAIPTKSEVYVVCGFQARAIHDAIKTVAALASTAAPVNVDQLREALEEYRAFAGETAGACLGLAMSTDHPAPDEVLMDIFRKSQALAAKTRAALASKGPQA